MFELGKMWKRMEIGKHGYFVIFWFLVCTIKDTVHFMEIYYGINIY
jgi:hypothetical protein